MILNLNNVRKSQVLYEYLELPDSQSHIKFAEVTRGVLNVSGVCVDVLCSLTSMQDLGKLSVALDAVRAINPYMMIRLTIPYLLGARQDRPIEGEANTCKVICNFINLLTRNYNLSEVSVLHPHSDVPKSLINNFKELDHTFYVSEAIEDFKPDYLIIPDAGAAKNASKYDKFGLHQIQCLKNRDVKTGKLSGFEALGEIPKGKKLLITDDLIDRGGTFCGISELFPDNSLALYTTHGLYSGGFKTLNKYFDKLYCTNSYHYTGLPIEIQDDSHKLTIFEV